MTNSKSNESSKSAAVRTAHQRSAFWKWGVGAGVVAAGLGAAAYNGSKARRSEEENPPLGQFIEVDGVRLHYLDQGKGPLVVLLHGNGTTIEDWLAAGIVEPLAESHRVLAFDRPGFGYSERPRTVVWTPAAQAGLIASALDALGATEVTLVGHSFGTLVAAELALARPDLTAALVLISGYYFPSVRLDALIASPPAIPLVGDAIRYTVSPLLGAASQDRAEKLMFSPAPVSSGWKKDFPFEMSLRPSQIRAAAADAALMVPAAAALAPRLAELRLPVTLVAGAGDKIVSVSGQSERLAEALVDSRLIVVEGAGHMVHHKAPAEIVSAIRASRSART